MTLLSKMSNDADDDDDDDYHNNNNDKSTPTTTTTLFEPRGINSIEDKNWLINHFLYVQLSRLTRPSGWRRHPLVTFVSSALGFWRHPSIEALNKRERGIIMCLRRNCFQ